VKKDYLGLFSAIVRAGFLGEVYSLDGNAYQLKPTLLDKYEVLRSVNNPASELERLVRDLPSDFKSVARSELYRKQGGWIDRGVEGRKIREVDLKGKSYVVPVLGKPTVGIDTSSNDEWTFICFACFDDAERAYTYLDRYLELPKSKTPNEIKWLKLNNHLRESVVQNLSTLLRLSCSTVLIVKTSALIKPEEKMIDIFSKLVSGCFTGFENSNGEERRNMRDLFFGLSNDVPIHCDSDFSPLSTDKVVRVFVQSLAAGRPFVPLHVGLKSEESHPIQVADVICGAFKKIIVEKTSLDIGMIQIPFDNKLKGDGKIAKAYYWDGKQTQAPRAVSI